MANLQSFADNLSTDNYNQFIANVKAATNKIFSLLRDQTPISVDRCSLVGGLAKKTSTPLKADADIVIFYNDKGQSQESVIEAIQKVFVDNRIRMNILITGNGIMKFVMDGISFDMLVAQNYVKNNSNHVEEQWNMGMLRLKQAGNNGSTPYTSIAKFGIEVTESSVAFMRNKSKLVQDVAKLAKYWNQIMLFKKYIYGRSSIMELLAVKAGLEEENNSSYPTIRNALKRFLIKVSKIDEVYEIFQDYYDKTEIHSEILSQRPLLMDPVNPFNNLLSGRCGYGYGKINSQSENIKEFMSFMKNAAKLSLDIMNRSSDHMNIFRPHPLLHQLPKNDRWIIPSKCMGHHVAIHPNNHADIQDPQNKLVDSMPSFILWNKSKSKCTDDLDAILKAYAGCIYNSTKIGITEGNLYWKVWNLVQEMNGMIVGEGIGRNTFFHDKPIKQFDITMKVPIKNEKSVCISFDFDLPR